MSTPRTTLRIGGLAAIAGLILAIVLAVGLNSGAPGANATGPTPTKIANDGSLSGVSDLLVGDLDALTGLFYCIAKTDHQASNNAVKVAVQCNIDVENAGVAPTGNTPPTWADTCDTLGPPQCLPGELSVPIESGPDLIAGPPPPPPYTVMPPSKGYGFFYPGGTGEPGDVCGTTDCTVVTTCFEEVGSLKTIGPNIIATAVILEPDSPVTLFGIDRVAEGSVDIWYNQSNASCKAGTPKGTPDFPDLDLFSVETYEKGGSNPNNNGAPWRLAAPGSILDFDGDGCSDEAELEEVKSPTAKCGDDPQNPFDSFDPNTEDLSGVYHITTRLARADCTTNQCTAGAPGIYIYCRADLQHDTGNNTLVMRPYCYADNTAVDINPEAYPGVQGDGFPGGPPPGPEYPSAGTGNYVYGDVDDKHTELTGTFTKTNPPSISVAGCIEDPDGTTGTGNVWFDLTGSAHMLPGTVSVYLFQDPDCAGSPTGTPIVGQVFFAKQPLGALRDDDVDGVSTMRELGDDTACGLRDPYNKNDYYDVSIPRDGVIDLANDILGVILHFAPGGYPPGDENWDRPAPMTNAEGGAWNRGSPDGMIDLPNDILGVILQFNPGGCPPA